jgi:hypothetical protein
MYQHIAHSGIPLQKESVMSTKNESTQTNRYAAGAMPGYHVALGMANQLVNSPYKNPFFSQTLAQGVNAANRMNQTSQSNTNSYIANSGIGTNSPAAQMLRQMSGYEGSHNTANAFLNASNQAQSMFGMGMNTLANPLVTGSTGVQKQSGLGTWLPQIVGAGIGAATSFMNPAKGLSTASKVGNAMGGAVGAMGGFGGFSGPSPFSPYTPSYGYPSMPTNPFGQ